MERAGARIELAESRLLGDGLPKSLDARRLKEFLKLSPQHRQTITGELSRISPTGWRRPGNATEFYEILLTLISSVDGRTAYVEAAKALKATEAVRKEKGDLALVLARDCVKRSDRKAPRLNSLKNNQTLSRCEARLADKRNWSRLAELVWARSLDDGSGDCVLRAIKEHGKLGIELKSVEDGLIEPEVAMPPEDHAAPDEGAQCLVSRVKKLAERLDEHTLEPIGELHAATEQLFALDLQNRVKTLAGQLDGLAVEPIAELHAATEQLLRIAKGDQGVGVECDPPGVRLIEVEPDPELKSPDDLPEEWQEAMSLCEEAFASLIGRIGCAELPLPEIGYELRTKRGEVIGEAEIAWPKQEVAIIREGDQENRQPFEMAGWYVLDDTVDVAVIAGALEPLPVQS